MAWQLDNSYTHLPADFYSRQLPTPVGQPSLVLVNEALAEELGLADLDRAELQAILAGNQLPPGAEPIAQAYAGHQFGHFTMLGDGRAILLGEQVAPNGRRWDIQLKGAGATPYSRRGDGRATLRAMLREYLMSEWIHYLGIPSSRSLAVVASGEKVFRERAQIGAVLTRVMSSHIRVGTFEFARNFTEPADLQTLTDYLIQRHYPETASAEKPVLALIEAVMQRQRALTLHWMRVGFIHGVMNTDNVSLAGETFDYGPCAFMNAYDPDTVFSSIDSQGRYAYGNQPKISHWNMAVWIGSLLPLIDAVEEKAVEQAQAILNVYPTAYREQWRMMMAQKLGFPAPTKRLMILLDELLQWMKNQQADYTNTFLALQGDLAEPEACYAQADFLTWKAQWEALLAESNLSFPAAQLRMRQHNPVYIPRNHQVEAALDEAVQKGDFSLFSQLLLAATSAYQAQPEFDFLQQVPDAVDAGYQTFCGT